MTEPNWETEEACGCKRAGNYASPCRFHWNEGNLKHELERAVSWAKHGRLDPEEHSDRQVLRFFDQLCYWAAKGIGDSGSVGSIYSAYSRERGS